MFDSLARFFSGKVKERIKPVVLVILDGWGVAPPSAGNAIIQAKKPNWDRYLKNYPHGKLIASGESVGLPANEDGNTEVGHLILGAGRKVYQDVERINDAIADKTFFRNQGLLEAALHAKKHKSSFHIMGLVGSGEVHSSVAHLYAILDFCRKEEVKKVYLHLFTDGRDSPPKEALEIIAKIEGSLKSDEGYRLATISGRYYAMDRDFRWERTKLAYEALVGGVAVKASSAMEALEASYRNDITDEFVKPTLVDGGGVVGDNDAVVFFNFRNDRARQLTMAFNLRNFEEVKHFDLGYSGREGEEIKIGETFKRSKVLKNLFFATMTQYHKEIPVDAVLFGPLVIEKGLSEVLSDSGLKHLHMAESEKQRFVTYYFDGLREAPFAGEVVSIVPSSTVATYDKQPEMSLPQLVKKFEKELSRGIYSFVVINFANPDMVAHTGKLKETIKACEAVDKWLGVLVKAVLGADGTVIVTGDHGNAEELLSYTDLTFFVTTKGGKISTNHSNNPVPVVIIGNHLRRAGARIRDASLVDVAPTVLNMLKLNIPTLMTGKNLLDLEQGGVKDE